MMDDPNPDQEETGPIDDWEWENGEDEERGEDQADESEETGNPRSDAEPFRIKENIARQVPVWTGVRSCDDASRAVREMKPYYDRWVTKTIAAHPDNVPVAKGYVGHRKWKNRKLSNGKRRCKGWFTSLVVYVDFQ